MIWRMDRLRTWLAANSVTQSAFAKDMDVSQPTVSDWLAGRMTPTVPNLKKMAELTGMSIDELLAPPPKRRAVNRVSA